MSNFSQNRKPLYFAQSYSARKCITKCPNCYNCQGKCKEKNNNLIKTSNNSNNKPKDQYPFMLEYQNGIYQGDLKNLAKENTGAFLSDDSLLYIGSWRIDQISSVGILFFPKGGFFYGHFDKNKLQGLGLLHYPNQNLLLGYWNRSKMHGPFFHYFHDKKLWVNCEYHEGLLMRYGKEEISEGIPKILREYPEMRKMMENVFKEDYLKEFKLKDQDDREEIRFLRLSKDLRYMGYTKKKSPHGLGVVFHGGSALFYGLFKDGVLDGSGRMNLENGDIYEGSFKDGCFNGPGVYYNRKNDNFIYGIFQKNACITKQKAGSSYPLSIITSFKKEEHRKNVKFYNKLFNFSVLSLGTEFTDSDFLEISKNIRFSTFFPKAEKKPSRKPLENIEIVQKSSSKSLERTHIIEVKTGLEPQKRVFNEIELFEDIIHGKLYQFPRNCLDFYDNNIDSYEVISQNNNVYNMSGRGRVRSLSNNKDKQKTDKGVIMQMETYEDGFKQQYRQHKEFLNESKENVKKKNFFQENPSFSQQNNENNRERDEEDHEIYIKEADFNENQGNILDFDVNEGDFLQKTMKKNDTDKKNSVFTIKKGDFDKENTIDKAKEPQNDILFLKKSKKTNDILNNSNQKLSVRSKNQLENDKMLNKIQKSIHDTETFKDISRISSIRMLEKTPEKQEKSHFHQKKLDNLINRDELNKLSDDMFLKVSRHSNNKLIFDINDDFVGNKSKVNESFRSSYSFVDRSKSKKKSPSKRIFDDIENIEKSF